ncbi:Protein kinase-like domain protein [Cordyceps fumosorosea ARSEF 2679]|uniref:Protein kinase-like domain protein n=1 Tax=Cordyceps fumosorosea (strain ARSEF 2679) TaxID=1081104 RepID=A0A168AMN9_CORFA|nr:Protein kinase-like domain protein [Cordyceps fumosorosea ARSEF 2679]OAA68950.1 Protein kinase-like domain protein [Cordyceps fumosorosea ARSEF 2679]
MPRIAPGRLCDTKEIAYSVTATFARTISGQVSTTARLGKCVTLPSRVTNTDNVVKKDHGIFYPAFCKAEDNELSTLFSKINVDALVARASQLRQGIECSVAPFQYDSAKRRSHMGGMNYHIEILFADNVVWVARMRRSNTTSPPQVVRDYIFESEVATLMFLETTAVPTPKVHGYALEHESNPVGVGYILMEKLPGKALDWPAASPDQRRKVMEQLADVLIEIYKHPLPALGSLATPGRPHVAAFAHESLLTVVGGRLQTCSPFRSAEQYRRSHLRLILDRILAQEMYATQPVEAYLLHRFLVDLVPVLTPPASGNEKFYLKHDDDKGDHILVDESFNITGIIDWEWAHTAAPAEAFNSPVGLLPVADFYAGKGAIGADEAVFAQLLQEKGHGPLAQFVLEGRVQHLFAFCCGIDLSDWDGFLGLFRGLRDASGVDAGMTWEDWKGTALDRYKEDAGLQELLIRCGSGNGGGG